VNGGLDNSASGKNDVVAGGENNVADAKFSTVSGGASNSIVGSKTAGGTISGGFVNRINNSEDSVITGGQNNQVCPIGNKQCSRCTISGGTDIACEAKEGVGTGGDSNKVSTGDRSVVTGGKDNGPVGKNSVIVGGKDNIADGALSIALGIQVQATKGSSMVINLNPDGSKILKSDKDGQFIANAKSFRLQIGTNNENLGIEITSSNINNLIDALKNAGP
jgi:hypothetical protein